MRKNAEKELEKRIINKQKWKKFNDLETRDEKIDRLRISNIQAILLIPCLVHFITIAVMFFVSTILVGYMPSFLSTYVLVPHLLGSLGLFGIVLLCITLSTLRQKTEKYKTLKQRYISQYNTKPEISRFQYIFAIL